MEQDITQEALSALEAELAQIRPNDDQPEPEEEFTSPDATLSSITKEARARNAGVRATLSELAERERVRKVKATAVSSLGKDSIKFHRFEQRYGWTYAQYAEYARLPPAEWKRLLDKERKRIKAAPRRTADLSQLSDIEKKLHRNAQNTRNQKKSRARKALAKGAVLLTDEELALFEVEAANVEAHAVQNTEPELAQLLADLRETEARENEADRKLRAGSKKSPRLGPDK